MTPDQYAKINKIKENHAALQDSFQAIFLLPDGQKVLKYLCKKFFVGKTTQVFGLGGNERTAYNNGQRDVVEAIIKFINKDKQAILKEIEDNYERAQY